MVQGAFASHPGKPYEAQRLYQFGIVKMSREQIELPCFEGIKGCEEALELALSADGKKPHAHKHDHKKHDPKDHGHHMHSKQEMEAIAKMRFFSDHPPEETYGRWESVIPKEGGGSIHMSLGMQTVHAILSPSGKILLI